MRGPSRLQSTTWVVPCLFHDDTSIILSTTHCISHEHCLPSLEDTVTLCARGCTPASSMTTVDDQDTTWHLPPKHKSLSKKLFWHARSSAPRHHNFGRLHRHDARWENTHFSLGSLRGFPWQENTCFSHGLSCHVSKSQDLNQSYWSPSFILKQSH